jgi:hypothetical protein
MLVDDAADVVQSDLLRPENAEHVAAPGSADRDEAGARRAIVVVA